MSSDNPSSPTAAAPTGEQQWRDIPIDWEALEDAFENNAPEVHSYLHVPTGDVLRIVDGIADPQMHARIAADTNYLRIEPVSSREQYRWMERYIPMVEDEELRTKLTRAIDGKGAFRRFKDVLMSYGPERERWFSFRSERLRIFMEAWPTRALNPVKRPVWVPDLVRDEADVEGAVNEQNAAADAGELREPRRGRNAESMRRQLRETLEILPPRDLEALAAFGEFLRARATNHPPAPPPQPSEPIAEESIPGADEENVAAPAAAAPAAPVKRTRARAAEKAASSASEGDGEPSSAKVPAATRARNAASG